MFAPIQIILLLVLSQPLETTSSISAVPAVIANSAHSGTHVALIREDQEQANIGELSAVGERPVFQSTCENPVKTGVSLGCDAEPARVAGVLEPYTPMSQGWRTGLQSRLARFDSEGVCLPSASGSEVCKGLPLCRPGKTAVFAGVAQSDEQPRPKRQDVGSIPTASAGCQPGSETPLEIASPSQPTSRTVTVWCACPQGIGWRVFAVVAQRTEQRTSNPPAVGSTPTDSTRRTGPVYSGGSPALLNCCGPKDESVATALGYTQTPGESVATLRRPAVLSVFSLASKSLHRNDHDHFVEANKMVAEPAQTNCCGVEPIERACTAKDTREPGQSASAQRKDRYAGVAGVESRQQLFAFHLAPSGRMTMLLFGTEYVRYGMQPTHESASVQRSERGRR